MYPPSPYLVLPSPLPPLSPPLFNFSKGVAAGCYQLRFANNYKVARKQSCEAEILLIENYRGRWCLNDLLMTSSGGSVVRLEGLPTFTFSGRIPVIRKGLHFFSSFHFLATLNSIAMFWYRSPSLLPRCLTCSTTHLLQYLGRLWEDYL